MPKLWTAEDVLRMAGGYHEAAVLVAAAELDAFSVLARGPMTAEAAATALAADPRGTTMLLDALAAMELLEKDGDEYRVPPGVADVLTQTGAHSVVAMARHQANCLRRWAQLAAVVKNGRPAELRPSIRGAAGDTASFIGAMDNVSAPLTETLIAALRPLQFCHLLDVGGGSGTWTIAFLRAQPDAVAALFDLPDVIPLAESSVAAAGLADRVTLVAGDFYTDDLPAGADLVWLGAITHQNSREQNRDLYAKAHAALVEGGRILVRDVVMEPSRAEPVAGALFAINMLVGTPGGGTYTFEEYADDLLAAGFESPELVRQGEGTDSVVGATKPAR